jgi:hypothetical protein
VQAVGVEPGDPLDDRELQLGSGAPDAVGDQLGLEGVDEALGHRVVVGVADGADRREHAVVVEDVVKRVAGVLAAGVGVMHEPQVSAGLAARQGHPQGVEGKVGAHVVGELPADDAAAVGVDDEAEEHDAFPAAQIREVGQPQRVGPDRGEVALDEIGAARRPRIRGCCAPRLATALGALDARLAHQALDAVTTGALAGAAECQPHLAIPVGEVVGLVRGLDHAEQPLVVDHTLRSLPRGALVVGGRRHVQHPADRLDTEAAAVLIDVAAHLVRSASSSVAKNTLADLRISLALRSSKFSARSLRISSRSAVVGRSGRAPLSACAWRTLLRSVSDAFRDRQRHARSDGRSQAPASRRAPRAHRGTSSDGP